MFGFQTECIKIKLQPLIFALTTSISLQVDPNSRQRNKRGGRRKNRYLDDDYSDSDEDFVVVKSNFLDDLKAEQNKSLSSIEKNSRSLYFSSK